MKIKSLEQMFEDAIGGPMVGANVPAKDRDWSRLMFFMGAVAVLKIQKDTAHGGNRTFDHSMHNIVLEIEDFHRWVKAKMEQPAA